MSSKVAFGLHMFATCVLLIMFDLPVCAIESKCFFFNYHTKLEDYGNRLVQPCMRPIVFGILCMMVVMDPPKGPLRHYLVSGSLN